MGAKESGEGSGSGPQRPNILWICTDQQRWDTLGCYGNPFTHTPNLDRLAAEGLRFNQAYVQNPLCQPSRGCFLTGRYPRTNGLTKNGQDINPGEIPITRTLAEAGYHCGLIGKLHLNACDNRIKDYGTEWWRHIGKASFDMREPRINDGYREFLWDHAPSGNPYSDYTKWVTAQGGSIEYRPREDCSYVDHGMPVDLHQTTWCANNAIDFIRRNKGNTPWLCSVNIFDPHFPFNPPDELLARYLPKLDEIPLPNFREGEWEEKPEINRKFAENTNSRWSTAGMTDRDHRMLRAAYWAMCDLLDIQVGRILEALDQSGQADNTIVLFMSDHGEMLGDHGLYTKGPFLYDPAIRVPLLVRWPERIPAGEVSEALVEIGDLAPTLLQAAGLPIPPRMQTRSMLPLWTDPAAHPEFREDVYSEYLDSNPDSPSQFRSVLRTPRWKIIRSHQSKPSELYDMKNDPLEQNNLWNDPQHAAIREELLERLCDRVAMTVDPHPPRVGIY